MSILFQIHACHFIQSIQLCQPPQSLQITQRRKRDRKTDRKTEREKKAVVITLPCLNFFTHSGVELKLCVARAGETTKQALLCEKWIEPASQRVYLCCWTIARDTFCIGGKMEERSKRSRMSSLQYHSFCFGDFIPVTPLKATGEQLELLLTYREFILVTSPQRWFCTVFLSDAGTMISFFYIFYTCK